jgi:hypothetical protein
MHHKAVVQRNACTSSIPNSPTFPLLQAVDVNVSFTTSDGTAVAGVDYDAASGVVTIPRGQTYTAINLTWACNAAWQPKANKTVIVTLSSPSPTVPLGTAAATLTIQEDTAVRPLCLATRAATCWAAIGKRGRDSKRATPRAALHDHASSLTPP